MSRINYIYSDVIEFYNRPPEFFLGDDEGTKYDDFCNQMLVLADRDFWSSIEMRLQFWTMNCVEIWADLIISFP